MLFVFDTNTIVSALLKSSSVPALALDQAQKYGRLVFSEESKNEILAVINRAKFDKYLSQEQRHKKLNQIILQSLLVPTVTPDILPYCRDPFDVKFLLLAQSEKLNCIVSGDNHLLSLHPFNGVPIINPSEFLKLKL
jgi:putative PIN family toxin of toxin-antitoxin system